MHDILLTIYTKNYTWTTYIYGKSETWLYTLYIEVYIIYAGLIDYGHTD